MEENKKMVTKHFFQFNAEKSEVKFERQNKFSGKSNFLSYIPAKNNVDERKMEAVWFQHQNKKL